jgi:hypothetical protein
LVSKRYFDRETGFPRLTRKLLQSDRSFQVMTGNQFSFYYFSTNGGKPLDYRGFSILNEQPLKRATSTGD